MVLAKDPYRRPEPRIVQFFLSPRGHKVSKALAGASALGISAFTYLSQTVFAEQFKNLIQFYEYGIPKAIDGKVLRHLDKAIEKVQLDDGEKRALQPFYTTYGMNFYTFGSFYSNFGAWLGIPINFSYDSVNDIDRTNIQIRDKQIRWSSEDGKQLQESFVFTEQEQIYGLSRALLDLRTIGLYAKSVIQAGSVVALYLSAQYLNRTELKLLRRPFTVRYPVYGVLLVFMYGVNSMITDMFQNGLDVQAEHTLAEMGEETIEAGISYYNKILKRNVALHRLSDKKMFTPRGDDAHLFRRKTVPISLRKEFLELELKKLRAKKAEIDTKEDEKKN